MKKRFSILHSLSSILVLLVLFLAVGCTGGAGSGVSADSARYEAMTPPVNEYKANHPEQAQTYTDLMRAWELSLSSRTAATQPVPAPSK